MNPERLSSINKVGGGTPAQQENILARIEGEFLTKKWYPRVEREKTSEETELIGSVIDKLNEFLHLYGARPLPIREDHIHLYSKENTDPDVLKMIEEKLPDSAAVINLEDQEIIIFDWKIRGNLDLANTISHELIHFISYRSVIVKGDSKRGFVSHRVGLEVDSPRENRVNFFGELNEALTEELSIRFFNHLKEIPLLKEEVEKVERARTENNDPDISVIKKGEKHGYSYPEFREKFNELINKIYKKRKGDFGDKEEIFNIFATAAMTGEVKRLTTLIESTFGSGSFKKIAQSLVNFNY